jgi:hypothetical protein
MGISEKIQDTHEILCSTIRTGGLRNHKQV